MRGVYDLFFYYSRVFRHTFLFINIINKYKNIYIFIIYNKYKFMFLYYKYHLVGVSDRDLMTVYLIQVGVYFVFKILLFLRKNISLELFGSLI